MRLNKPVATILCLFLLGSIFGTVGRVNSLWAVQVTALSQNADTIRRFEKVEVAFSLDQSFNNPFDPDVVDIMASITQPDQSRIEVPAFFYQRYQVSGSGPEKYTNPGPDQWQVRFAPAQTGAYTYDLVIRENGQPVSRFDNAGSFTCTDSLRRGIVRRDPADTACLRYENGQPYIPIGHNICWTNKGLATYQNDFSKMGAAGENWTRLWMTHFNNFSILEWRSDYSSYYQNLGRYSQPIAQRLDALIEKAEQEGVAIQLVLQHHGQFSTTTNSNWSENPFNSANSNYGGFLDKPDDFFTDAEARRLTRNKYRYIVARWGYSPAILAWELFNEVQYTDGWKNKSASVVTWHNEMSRYLRGIDPHRHLITTSSHGSGFDALWRLPDIDLVQYHHYGTPVIGLFNSTARALAGQYGKPAIIGEFGAGDIAGMNAESNVSNLPEPFQAQMRAGLVLHNGIWSAFMAKSGAHLWWWDSYIEPYDQYKTFAPLAQFAAGEDLAGMNLAGRAVEGFASILASPQIGDFSYVHTQTMFTEQDGYFSGMDKLSRFLQGTWHNSYRSDPTFNLTLAEAGRLKIHVKQVAASGTNSLRVRVNGVSVFTSVYPAGSDNFTIEVPLPAGTLSVQIQNTGQDWFDISGYEFAPAAAYPLDSLGLVDATHALLWIYDTNSQLGHTAGGPYTDEALTVYGLTDGLYQVEYYRTRVPGGLLERHEVTVHGGVLSDTIPTFSQDIAVKIVPVCQVTVPHLAKLATEWLKAGTLLQSDYYPDNLINNLDLSELSSHWLMACPIIW